MFEEIDKHFTYDKETGLLYWKLPRANRVKQGQVAGTKQKNGYYAVCFKSKRYYIHRIAWLLSYGSLPEGDTDHINRDPSDNRLGNLRCVTHQENLWNTDRKGYFYSEKRNRFIVDIRTSTGKKRIGYFKTEEEAKQAYATAKKERNDKVQ